jgi:hypothetical protein
MTDYGCEWCEGIYDGVSKIESRLRAELEHKIKRIEHKWSADSKSELLRLKRVYNKKIKEAVDAQVRKRRRVMRAIKYRVPGSNKWFTFCSSRCKREYISSFKKFDWVE